MRPVVKSPWPRVNGHNKSYRPHNRAKNDLIADLGNYCSYCEIFIADAEVEHIISRNQDPALAHNWDNFLLACGRCNGKGNKGHKPVDLNTLHFPHLNNTCLSFIYKEGGYVTVNTSLTGNSLINARNLLKLVGLDKIPGNPEYPRINENDTRWNDRRLAWEYAKKYLSFYEEGNLTEEQLVDFAIQKGFFSVWYTVYQNHPLVRERLIREFTGTAPNCFDAANNFVPIHRNPQNANDPI